MTMQLIQTITAGSGGISAFSLLSIPQTFTDLKLVLSLRDTATGDAAYGFSIVLNNDSTSGNYSYGRLMGNGSSPSTASSSGLFTTLTYNGGASTSNTFSNGEIYFPNYAGSTQKSYSIDNVLENNATTAYQSIWAALYNQTTAISRIDIGSSGSFAQHSTVSLYGITKA